MGNQPAKDDMLFFGELAQIDHESLAINSVRSKLLVSPSQFRGHFSGISGDDGMIFDGWRGWWWALGEAYENVIRPYGGFHSHEATPSSLDGVNGKIY